MRGDGGFGARPTRRRRLSSAVVLVCFVADFIRHNSAAAAADSATDAVDQLAELANKHLDNDESQLLVAAKGSRCS